MNKLYIINGPNMNLLGIREPQLYGKVSYETLTEELKKKCRDCGFECECLQSNYEGDIIGWIQAAGREAMESERIKFTGIILNAAGYSHTSVAILDALKAVMLPTAEVHITDPDNREEFRKTDYPAMYAEKRITGKGINGYKEAIEYMAQKAEMV